MRTWKPTWRVVHGAEAAWALGKRRRSLGLTLILVSLAIPLAAEAGPSSVLGAEKHSEIAAPQTDKGAEVVTQHRADAEVEQLQTLLEGLTGRIAKLEKRMNHVVPPAPRVRCGPYHGCWVE